MTKYIQKFTTNYKGIFIISAIICLVVFALAISNLFIFVKNEQCSDIEKFLIEKQYGHVHTKDIIKQYKKINPYCYKYTGYLESGLDNANKFEVYYNLSFRADIYNEKSTSKLFARKAMSVYSNLENNQQDEYKSSYSNLRKLENGTYWGD